MNFKHRWSGLLMILALWVAGPAWAQPASSAQGKAYTAKGADTCLDCHDKDGNSASYAADAIFKGKHGQRGHPKAPFAPGQLQCESCHGPGAQHARKNSDKSSTIVSFKADSFVGVRERNQVCLGCHQDSQRNAWHGGAHDRSEVACTDCHKLHTPGGDKVLAKLTQAETCYTCHKSQRLDFQKPSSHPVRFGKMACSDCHKPHGSPTAAMLNRPTLNQTCTDCHAEKRGPMLWEHAPVTEDCSLCHSSHGSVRSALLNKSAPLLCQQCHSSSGHPSVPRTPAGLPGGGGGGTVFIAAGSCSNCHTQVHGSNHPAGRKLMR